MTVTLRKPSVGSISSGTMRTEDLLGNFAWELEHVSADPVHVALVAEAREREERLIGADSPDETNDDSECLAALFDALNELAPAYCRFGAHEGDGADYGFWPIMDAIDELPRIADPADMPEGGTGEDVAFVNDRGNVTIYDADGSILLELV